MLETLREDFARLPELLALGAPPQPEPVVATPMPAPEPTPLPLAEPLQPPKAPKPLSQNHLGVSNSVSSQRSASARRTGTSAATNATAAASSCTSSTTVAMTWLWFAA